MATYEVSVTSNSVHPTGGGWDNGRLSSYPNYQWTIPNYQWPIPDYQWPSNYTYYTYPYPTTIYKYQIQCPKCKTMNWLQLDIITECTGYLDKETGPNKRKQSKCGASLKAVTRQADYELPVVA